MKKTWTPTITSVAARIVTRSSPRLPRPRGDPVTDDHGRYAETGEDQSEPEEEPVLKPHAAADPLERWVAVAELVDGIRTAT